MSNFKVWRDWWTYHWAENRAAVVRRVASAAFALQLGFWLTTAERVPVEADATQHGWVQIGLMVLSAGLSILAGQLLNKKSDSPLRSDKPTTLATRGSYTNWFVGIRRVGPVFCWAGDREIRKEKQGGGKGGPSAPDAEIFYEAGWHVLGIGPVRALHQIIQGGEVIFQGPITSESHPSGTTVNLGKEGSFVIYWGEQSQPVNTFLGNANRVSVSSRWPFVCYVQWHKKRLSGSPNWPILDYVVERRTSNSVLSGSPGFYEPNQALTGDTFLVIDAVSSATESVGYLQFAGDKTASFKPTVHIEATGVGSLTDGEYEVLRSEVVQIVTGTTFNGFNITSPVTRVYLQDGTLGATGTGSVQLYEADDSDGANIAHVIAEVLFASFPQGLGFDPNHLVERWDTATSLEELGVEADTDEWRAGVLGTEGETAEALLAAMLQDHGTMLPIDTTDGALSFKRVRFPVGTLPALSSEIYADTEPEIETMHGEWPVDRVIFTFSDRSMGFGDMTITIDDDGQASYLEHSRARKVPMVSTVQFATAAKLSELRSGEELSHGAEFRIDAGREARELVPGDAITAAGFEQVLRVLSVEIDPLSEKVKLKVMPDFYGAPKSSFVTGIGGGQVVIQDPEQDEVFRWIEVPEQALGAFPSTMTVLAAHIRDNEQITFASLWISRDNSTYMLHSNDTQIQTGGTLDDALTADGPTYVAQGPEYTELGPDNATLTQDLSADLTNWGAGRQIAVIVSSAGTEICFVQKATITGASTRRLDGLLRARYDTRKLAHPVGAHVFIFDMDAITEIQDVLLEPGEDFYLKTQPGTNAGQVNLSAVPPYGEELYGKGQRPIKPSYVNVRAPFLNSPSFQTGDDITISWALSTGTPGTGAGGQSAGTPIAAPDIPGTVQIELLTTGNTLQATIGVDAIMPEYEITNAALVAAFGSEPSAFNVRITHTANGRNSPVSDTLTITRVA